MPPDASRRRLDDAGSDPTDAAIGALVIYSLISGAIPTLNLTQLKPTKATWLRLKFNEQSALTNRVARNTVDQYCVDGNTKALEKWLLAPDPIAGATNGGSICRVMDRLVFC